MKESRNDSDPYLGTVDHNQLSKGKSTTKKVIHLTQSKLSERSKQDSAYNDGSFSQTLGTTEKAETV